MTVSRSVPVLTLICLLAAYSLTGEASGDVPPEPSATDPQLEEFLEALPHATFEWQEAEGVSDRGSIRVPVTLDGEEGWLQLDTGVEVTLLYGEVPIERGWEEHDGMYRVPSVEIGEMELGPMWFRSRPDIPASNGLLGTLGLDALAGGMVFIDYPGRRLALTTYGAMPEWLLKRTSWAPATVRDCKFFPHVNLGGKTATDLFFDTGSSAYIMIVDRDVWIELTGCLDPKDAAIRQTAWSWGSSVTAVGEPAQGTLVIGSLRIPSPDVFFIEERPEFFAQWPFPTRGLIGNAALWDHVVVLDLGVRPGLGIVR